MKRQTLTLSTILIWGILFTDLALSSDVLSSDVVSSDVLSSDDVLDDFDWKSGIEIATTPFGKIRMFKRSITLINNNKSPGRLFRRQTDQKAYGLYYKTKLDIFRYLYPPKVDARIADNVFSCQQTDGTLIINRDGSVTPQFVTGLYEWHPEAGIWWFIQCIELNSRAGGYGLDMTNVQKPGGDSGINPKALKSLVG